MIVNLGEVIACFFFWPLWVFVAARRLSLVAASGGYSLLLCAGFSLRWLLVAEHGLQAHGLRQLQHSGSVVAAHRPQSVQASVVAAWALGHTGFSSCGSWALEHRLSSCGARAKLLCRSFQTRDRPPVPCIGRRIFFFFEFIYLFLAALGLHCCVWAFSSCGEWGLLVAAVRGLLLAVASLVAELGLQAHGLQQLWLTGSVVVARGLQSAGSVVVAHRLSCSTACGIFPDQGLNPCPLHLQADSQPLCHQGSPFYLFLYTHIVFFQTIWKLLADIMTSHS